MGCKALGLSGSRVSGMVSFVALRTMAKVSAFLRLWVWALSVAQGSVFGAFAAWVKSLTTFGIVITFRVSP